MYAVFRVGGHQFRGEEGTVINVPLQKSDKGSTLDISEVLLIKNGEESLVGTPFVEGAKVEAEVIEHGKDDKIRIYKYKRRTKYRRTQGHRQDFTTIRLNRIHTP